MEHIGTFLDFLAEKQKETSLNYLLEGGEDNERQEKALIQGIRWLVKTNKDKPVSLEGIPDKVTDAYKETSSPHGHEPYTDIVLVTTKGKLNISCKGPTAYSLAGGGLAGMMKTLETEHPTVINNFNHSIISAYDRLGLVDGKIYPAQKVPDLSIKIPEELKLVLVKGTKAMGGPIDYMYVGSMDNVLSKAKRQFTGKFIPADLYAKGNFYLRVRKRDLMKKAFLKSGIEPRIKYTPTRVNDRNQQPIILTVATNIPILKGKNAMRLVITDKPIGKVVPYIGDENPSL